MFALTPDVAVAYVWLHTSKAFMQLICYFFFSILRRNTVRPQWQNAASFSITKQPRAANKRGSGWFLRFTPGKNKRLRA